MRFSDGLYRSWQCFCAAELGHFLEINEIGVERITHKVPDGQPPIKIAGDAVRIVTMAYDSEDLNDELPN